MASKEQHIPRELNVVEFAKCRALEMAAMEKAARTVIGNNLVMQQVPRHMRRRAAGHDVRRLPRRLREQAQREREQAGATPKKSKRPSRKHRRRPKNLLEEYSRRQRDFVWLETHIWHAKRFHMDSMWGYKVPIHPNDKGARAAYRGATNHCLIQDISYTCCIEIQGSEDDIITGLTSLTSPDTGLTFKARLTIRGNQEGNLTLYKKDQYPFGALSRISFMWMPVCNVIPEIPSNHSSICTPESTASVVSERKLWIWVHPSSYQAVFNELCAVFGAVKYRERQDSAGTEEKTDETSDGKHSSDVSSAKPTDCKQRTADCKGKKIHETYSNGTVKIVSQKDELNRFRLTGPLSLAVLTDALIPAKVQRQELKNEPDSSDQPVNSYWWEGIYPTGEHLDHHSRQSKFWESMKTHSDSIQSAFHKVLGLTVRDPRLFLPEKKTKITTFASEETDLPQPDLTDVAVELSYSPLWEGTVREQVKQSRQSNDFINKQRAKLIPGSFLDLGDAESRIPVLLVHSPGSHTGQNHMSSSAHSPPGLAGGWDLILPADWSMSFWIALIYRGARAVGLNEQRSISLEEGNLLFPFMYPDTDACQELEMKESQRLETKFDRMPPAKRPNYVKLGRPFPFHNPWQKLLGEWVQLSGIDRNACGTECSDKANFYVLRHKGAIEQVSTLCAGKFSNKSERNDNEPQAKKLRVDTVDQLAKTCLVAVKVVMIARGVPSALSSICIPSCEDLTKLLKQPDYSGPLEAHHPDPTKKNNKNKEKVDDNPGTSAPCNVRTHGNRQVIGYVSDGKFMLSSGKGAGIGFVVLPGLKMMLESRTTGKKAPIVLIRETKSFQYRFAYLYVINV